MNQKTDDAGTRYSRMFCAAVVIALLGACARTDSSPPVSAEIEASSEVDVTMPEVVVIATRPRADSRG